MNSKSEFLKEGFLELFKQPPIIHREFNELLVRCGTDFISINPDAVVFTRKLVASIEQRIILEKALGKIKVDPDWDLPDPDEEQGF